jgi:hypothetical protein
MDVRVFVDHPSLKCEEGVQTSLLPTGGQEGHSAGQTGLMSTAHMVTVQGTTAQTSPHTPYTKGSMQPSSCPLSLHQLQDHSAIRDHSQSCLGHSESLLFSTTHSH